MFQIIDIIKSVATFQNIMILRNSTKKTTIKSLVNAPTWKIRRSSLSSPAIPEKYSIHSEMQKINARKMFVYILNGSKEKTNFKNKKP